MSLFSSPALFLALSLWVVLLKISPAHSSSLTCTSQNFTNSKRYVNCSDLPTLNASLHYTYNATNSSLSFAFIAAPSTFGGWIGWGINPNATGMAGTQVLLAFKLKGVLVAKTYNLESYGSIKEEKLSFDTWDVPAESSASSGEFVIFASIKVPEKAESVNQIWQVGPSVSSDGKPGKHEFGDANKQAKATLTLVAAAANTTSNAATTTTTPAAAPTGANSTTDSKSSGFRLTIAGFFYFGLFAVLEPYGRLFPGTNQSQLYTA